VKDNKKDGAGGTDGGEVHAGCLCGNFREKDKYEGNRRMIILKWILQNHAWRAWNGFIWLWIGAGGLL